MVLVTENVLAWWEGPTSCRGI